MMSACNGLTGVTEKSFQLPDTSTRFASGTKAVRVNLSNRPSATAEEPKGSFRETDTALVPSSTVIPDGYPGYDGSSAYNPGVSAAYYFDVDGSTPIAKPSWVRDIQVGYFNYPTDTDPDGRCSMFGDSSTSVSHAFQTSEYNCHSKADGSGTGSDGTFIRVVLDRDQNYIGTKENLLIQLEYEATGLLLNPDQKDSADSTVSTSTNPEQYVDQLWKVFSGASLASTATPTPFAMVVPPSHAHHCSGGSGSSISCTGTVSPTTTVKQLVFPLTALTDKKYIQISRVRGGRRYFSGARDTGYYNSACTTPSNNPHCLGVVFRSLTLIRI